VIIGLGQWVLFGDEAPRWILAGLAAWAGVILATYPFSKEVSPELTARDWLHQVVAGWSQTFLWWGIVVGIAVLMPAELDWNSWVLLGVYFGATVAWVFGGLIWFGKKMRVFRPAPEQLKNIVEEVSQRMKIPVRGVWLAQSSASTAYILPYTRDVFFSSNLLEKLGPDEIAAICAHELGHCCEPRRVLIARLASCLAWVPFLFIKPWFHHSGLASVFMAVGANWIIRLWMQDLNHHMEVKADRHARENEIDAGVYARALARVYEDNLAPAVLHQKHSHPHLYDRLVSAGIAPNFARPAPPDSRSIYNKFLWVVLIVVGIIALGKLP
jgi:Zn-dependent protease with chaperone function